MTAADARYVLVLLLAINTFAPADRSALGPLIAGAVSDALTARFAAEALRNSPLLMSLLTLAGGLFFWRASQHYPADLARAGIET